MPGYNRVVISGTLGDGAEIWSVGVNFFPDDGPLVQDPSDLGQWAAAIVAGPVAAMPAALTNGLSSSGRVTEVSCYFYADIGDPAISVGTATANKVGTGSGTMPLSTACVATLLTALAGRRYRGRLYWPAVGWECDPDGSFDSTLWEPFSEDVSEFLEGLATSAPGATDLRPAVVSQAGGFITPVISVRSDDSPDTQRRRDEGLVPNVEVSPYPVP